MTSCQPFSEMGNLKEMGLDWEWAKVEDYAFKFGHIDFRVTLGFPSEALHFVFEEGDIDFRKERVILEVRSHNV